jgi:hypothetical protein
MAVTFPISNEFIEYNIDQHKYFLTDNAIENLLNIDLSTKLKSAEEKTVFLNQVTWTFYNWLYGYVRPELIRVVEWRIANNFSDGDVGIPYFDAMQECLIAQAYYLITFDGDLKSMDLHDKKFMIAPQAKTIARASTMATKQRLGARITTDDYRSNY